MFFQKKRKKLETHLGSHRDPAWYTTLQMRNVVILVFLDSERCKFVKWPADNAQKMTLFSCWMNDEWVWRSSVPPVTSVEINKHKIFDANNA